MTFLRPFLACLLLVISTARAETIRVAAAISLKDAVGEIKAEYESKSGDKLEFNFGSSGQLMAQIKAGADVDVFISAANKQIDDLAKEKLVDASSRRIVVMNTLVLVVPPGDAGAPASFEALADASVKKLAIGEPKSVPAGQYAAQVLASLKLSDKLGGRLVYGTNVRQVLSYVERGEVSAGIVYATDAKEAGDKVRVTATAGPKLHEPIVYPGVVVAASKKHDAAVKFLDHLAGPEAATILAAKGFGLPESKAGEEKRPAK
jgi:molybdate transport system substrate-binding protein